jgi:hypothetical protein
VVGFGSRVEEARARHGKRSPINHGLVLGTTKKGLPTVSVPNDRTEPTARRARHPSGQARTPS